jgi:hypothetical protein
MSMRLFGIFGLGLGLGLGACSHTGLGDAVRTDITARMQTVHDPVAACYAERLKANRKLRGTMTLAVTAEAKTGQFTNVRVAADGVGDAELGQCVVAEVSKLKLAEPTKSAVQFEYPLAFAPNK